MKHGGKIKFTHEHVTLIIASLAVMGRDIRDDSNVSQSEKEKVYRVVDEIKALFHNAYFADSTRVIVDPEGFICH